MIPDTLAPGCTSASGMSLHHRSCPPAPSASAAAVEVFGPINHGGPERPLIGRPGPPLLSWPAPRRDGGVSERKKSIWTAQCETRQRCGSHVPHLFRNTTGSAASGRHHAWCIEQQPPLEAKSYTAINENIQQGFLAHTHTHAALKYLFITFFFLLFCTFLIWILVIWMEITIQTLIYQFQKCESVDVGVPKLTKSRDQPLQSQTDNLEN